MQNTEETSSSVQPLTREQKAKLLALAKAKGLKPKAAGSRQPIPLAPRVEGGMPLAPVQRGLWFMSQMESQAPERYLLSMAYRFSGQVDTVALQAALDRIVARHEILRTRVVNVAGTPRQLIASADSGFALEIRTLSDASEPLPDFTLRPDPEAGLLLGGQLVCLGEGECLLRIALHHLIADGWSLGIFLHELNALYTAFSEGQADPLPPLPIQYADYAAWQHAQLSGEALETQRDYWRTQLRGAPTCLALPTDRPRPRIQDYDGACASVTLDAKLLGEMKALARRHGCTLFMTLLAGWAALMSRLSAQDDIVIGVPTAGRHRSEVESLIGMFVNTQALRIDLSDPLDTPALLMQVRDTALAAQRYADIPLEQVVEAVAPTRSLSHSPLFQVMLSLQNTPQQPFTLPGVVASPLEGEATMAQVDLNLTLTETDEGCEGTLCYAKALFDADTVRRYLSYWLRILRGMAQQPDCAVQSLPLLSADERRQVLDEVNATQVDYPRDACVHELVEYQAAAQPEALAVVSDERTLSYGELNRMANQLAHWLVAHGAGPETRVAVALPRGPELIASLLAVLKAGAAYVPLDPAQPSARLNALLHDCAPIAVIASQTTRGALGELPDSATLLECDDATGPWTRCAEDNLAPLSRGLTAKHPAYLIYTSGSTGRPKGVTVPHRAVVNFLHSQRHQHQAASHTRVLAVTTVSFDIHVLEIYLPLIAGGQLHLASDALRRDGERLGRYLNAQAISLFQATPATWKLLLAAGWEGAPGLTGLIGGEAFSPTLAAALIPRVDALWNMYGPTETTVWSTTWRIGSEEVSIPIGHPIANTRVYLLDAEGQPVPTGVPGEIYIGGDGVSLGYFNRPDLTAERFLPDPFCRDTDARMYQTGDLGRRRPDGVLEYLGRNDFQVKIRGFRIELGEIETALLACAGVREAVVTALSGEHEEARLVAYYVAEADAALTREGLRTALSERLPDYMVPAAWVALENVPLTPNGKVDRKALPAPDESAYAQQPYEAPQGETETALAAIWQSLLGVQKVSRHDNFFALGGHSLLAMQLVSRVQETLHRALPLATLFAYPSISGLAASLDAASQETLTEILPLKDGEDAPLSLAQRRIWVLSQMDAAAGDAYVLAGGLKLEGPLNTAALRQALDRVYARHDVLRTHIEVRDGTPVQVIEAENRSFPLSVVGLDDPRDPPSFQPTFDLTAGPLAQAQLVTVSEKEHWLRLALHHIIADGWSIGVLMKEIGTLYAAFNQHQDDPLPALPIQYGDYAAWQQHYLCGDRMQAQQHYWTEQLRGAPECLTLPTDRSRPQTQDYRGGRVAVSLDAELTQSLKALSQRGNATLYMTLMAGWAALMSRLSGQEDVVIGSPNAGRHRREVEPLIGMFVNTQALRVDLSAQPDAVTLLEQVKATAQAAQTHADIPFEQVVETLAPSRSLSHSPIFQVMMTLQNTPEGALTLPGMTVTELQDEATVSPFDLSLVLSEQGDELSGGLYFARALFDESTVRRYLGYWQRLLAGMVSSPTTPVTALPLLSEEERRQVLCDFNATHADYPTGYSLHSLFETQAARQPDAQAVLCGGLSLRYGELNAQANQLAHWLKAQGVRPGDRVAIALDRGCDLIVALLAALKSGAAYVPLDPALPTKRLAYILEDSAPQAVVTSRDVRERLGALPSAVTLVLLEGENRPWAQLSRDNLPTEALGLTPHHPAYLIYTSGSTGQPKGVMVEHGHIVNLVHWHQEAFALRAEDISSCVAGLGFDAAAWEIWPPLSVGARLVMPTPEISRDPQQLLAWWAAQPLDVSFLPTPVAELAFARDMSPSTLRALLVGGDRLKRRPPAGARFTLFNNYGPTENTVVATSGVISADETALHIGRPIANTRVYILDAQGEPVPPGVCGELFIGGVQVARGYVNRPDLTAERFLPDPFVQDAEARMYQTGDLGRWRSDGTIDYLGRNDFQLKIRGFRIELGEIESALLDCEGIREAVVEALSLTDQTQEKRLVAYYTSDDPQGISADGLREQLSSRLPAYMLPVAWMALAEMPLTANGKVDRKALPLPDHTAFSHQPYAAPQGDMETTLAAIWQSLLGVENVSRYDDFFALGGHSLLAVQLISRLREALGRELSLAALFARPALHDVAAVLGAAAQSDLAPIRPRGSEKPRPLSLAQRRIWFLTQRDANASAAYVIAGGIKLAGALDVSALQRALDRIVARHAALRTHIECRDGEPVQVVEPEDRGFPLQVTTASERHDERASFTPEFDLTAGPLARGQLVQVSAQEHWLRLALHHIIADGWSLGVMMNELRTLYSALIQDQPDPLPEMTIQFGDYAEWQREHTQGEVLQAQQAYWVAQLQGIPACLTLPSDRPRPAVQDYRGASLAVELDRELTQSLKALSQRCGGTLFMTLLAGWSALLSRLSGQDDVVIGTPVAGRHRRELEPLIGMFVNTQALRVDMSADPDAVALIAQIRETQLAAQAHADIPFEQVVEALAPARSLSHGPVFQAMLAWQNLPAESAELPGLTLSPLHHETQTAQCDLILELREEDDRLVGNLNYAVSLFDDATVQRYLRYWVRLLQGMVSEPNRPVQAVPLLSSSERQRVLSDFNETRTEYPTQKSLPALFEERARRHPDAQALMCGEQRLSYGELDARANQLAGRLVDMGVRPGSRVAIALARSRELIVAILATLKAGGAYVPLDGGYPQAHLQFILADSASEVLITDSTTGKTFDGLPLECAILNLDCPLSNETDKNEHGLAAPVRCDASQLAYIMYTSGSTGKPKGVMVEHGNIVKLVINNGYAEFRQSDRVACLANPAFDASTMEIWGPLLNGGCIVLFSQDTVLDPVRFADELQRQRVDTVFMTIALFNQYADTLQPVLPNLRYLMVGGESLDLTFVRRVLRVGPPQNFLHMYGPTETTTYATAFRMNDADPGTGSMPIGRPIANTTLYILDRYRQPVPVGVSGELYIGGAGVARGYLNLDEQTTERFLPDPFSNEPGARMYKTGDLGRWLSDGNIEFMGRNDFQVKIRGFRIEPEEIAAALQTLDEVSQAVVIVRTTATQEKQLVAYFTASEPDVDIASLQSGIGARLPAYMVPSAYVQLEKMPLTPNGKVNRAALPEPDDSARVRCDYEAPQGRIERTLAEIWQRLLGVEQVSRHDDFFALGGHSLLALRLVNEARQQGVQLTLSSLFSAPQLQALAAEIQTQSPQVGRGSDQAIVFRATGSQRPLFIVPEASGELFYGPLLTRCINDDIPVYGLPGPDCHQPPFATLEAAAARYVRIIRAAQPEGPYRLIGWSFGGTMVYEIAAQLLGQDQQVEFMGMLDTRLPDSPEGFTVPLDELLAMTDEEEMMAFLVRGDLEAMANGAVELQPDAIARARRGRLEDHYDIGRETGIFPEEWSPSYYRGWLRHRLALLRVQYRVPTLPLKLDLFIAQDEPSEGGRYLGWERVLPTSSIRRIPVPGDHRRLVSEPYVQEVGEAISEALRTGRSERESSDDPVVALQAGSGAGPTLLCIPGAGDNVFAFKALVQSLPDDWTVLGLQPRGLWGSEVPHTSVEAAAACYQQALSRYSLTENVHLLGHSFGGWVALELAARLETAGIVPASLLLVDSDAPEPQTREYTDIQALMSLAELFEMRGCSLELTEERLASLSLTRRLEVMLERLIAQGVLPKQTKVSALAGIYRVFSTNIRTAYRPTALPSMAPVLVMAKEASPKLLSDWQAVVPTLRGVYGEGNHIELLTSPCVQTLSELLRR
ncbi:amino acid adenylation domain-containing protein [Lonsdalea quercina]|uniref:non-ribosomal peptide synthetase n=1 Tax=Lonsdalea quercina TaxID=71657 RepID=UPI0039763B54